MVRVTVFLRDELLAEIDAEAKEKRITRSALIRAALENHLEYRRSQREEGAKRRKMRATARKIDELAKKLGKWETQLTVRKFRGPILGVTGPGLKGSSKLVNKRRKNSHGAA